MTTEKERIKLELCDGTGVTDYWEGRCLGLITPEEYAALVEDLTLVNKLSTGRTVHLSEIAKMDDIDGYRLVLMVKSKDGTQVFKKTMLITESIEIIANVIPSGGNSSINFNTENHYISATVEKE